MSHVIVIMTVISERLSVAGRSIGLTELSSAIAMLPNQFKPCFIGMNESSHCWQRYRYDMFLHDAQCIHLSFISIKVSFEQYWATGSRILVLCYNTGLTKSQMAFWGPVEKISGPSVCRPMVWESTAAVPQALAGCSDRFGWQRLSSCDGTDVSCRLVVWASAGWIQGA